MPIPLRSSQTSLRAYYDRHGGFQAVKVQVLPKGRRIGIAILTQRSHRDARLNARHSGLIVSRLPQGYRINGMLLDKETAEQLFFALEEALFPTEQ